MWVELRDGAWRQRLKTARSKTLLGDTIWGSLLRELLEAALLLRSPAHTGSPVWEWRRGMCWARPQGATGSGFRGLVGEDRGGGWLALVPLSWATRRVGPAVNWPLLSLLCAVHAVRCTGALQRYWASTVAGLPCPKSQLPSGSEQPDKTDVLTHVV
jgi:hypothetical protein